MTEPILRSARWIAAGYMQQVLRPGDRAVDATMGNGHDTQRMAELVGPEGRVIAFDIQAQAVEKTRLRLTEAGLEDRVTLVRDSHARMAAYLPAAPRLIAFNLGFLPGGDKAVTTLLDSTLTAVDAAMELLAFSNILDQFGSYLNENSAVVITGRLSVRDEKEPQMIVNRVRPIGEVAALAPEAPAAEQTLYLRLPCQDDPRLRKVRAILGMFPGQGKTVLFFADTRTRYGTKCAVRDDMLAELSALLGADSVVLK